MLVGAPEEGHQRHMDEQTVLPADLEGYLPHCLDEGLGLDISDGASDLGDDHIGVGVPADVVHKLLDLVGDVWDDLYGGSEILPLALLVEHVPVHLSGGEVGELVEVFVYEPLIVSQVQVRLRSVLCHVYLSVLIGAHGPGVDVDIGVQFLGGHLEASGLEQPSQGSGGYAFPESGYDSSGNENVLRHEFFLHHSTVTDFARFLGLSISHFLHRAV